ncbi:uncharacterized protein LOC108137103 [Drosophila elegans]|uniref:uncharacterized protein LOC108137103 n=1 Tax=Drosophila elegans TaxID=30023 RepID=UPI0007E84273|nr:uncharacterized protein LOC108137103 [Drosophila elegans]
MAIAKVNLWISQIRDMGRSLLSTDKAKKFLSGIQTAIKPLPSSSSSSLSKKCPFETNDVPITKSDMGNPAIPKIDGEMSTGPKNGFISRVLYYRRFYMKR